MMGWQIYLVANGKIVGCIGKSGLMTRAISNVETFDRPKPWCHDMASRLLQGPHPLDHHGKVTVSLRFHVEVKSA
jgi:hypothetical protein